VGALEQVARLLPRRLLGVVGERESGRAPIDDGWPTTWSTIISASGCQREPERPPPSISDSSIGTSTREIMG